MSKEEEGSSFSRRHRLTLVSLVFLFSVLLLAFFYYRVSLTPVNRDDLTERVFIVSPGESLRSVALDLKTAGLIRSVWSFLLLARQENLAAKIQAGDFRLSASMSAREIAQSLTTGSIDVWVTIIPGTRAEEVALVLAKVLNGFDVDWLKKLQQHEGYLTPDSYLVPRNANWDNFWQILTKNYQTKVDSEVLSQAEERGLDEKKLVILASLVEREAKTFADQQAVAGVLLNRFNNHWPLQIDASVQYALANQLCSLEELDSNCSWWPQVSSEDLKSVLSSYNTYRNESLPPGPICNPAPSTIRAVATVPQESPFWYYISDHDGQLHLAQSLAEHEENISLYLK